LRQPQASLDALDHSRDDLAEPRVVDAVAQIDQRLDERDTGRRELLHVEAEIDQLGALDGADAQPRASAAARPPAHEVQAHALEALLEVAEVDGLDLPEHRLAPGVDRLVGEQCHVRPAPRALRYMRSVRSTTRISSSSEVEPSRT